MAVFWWKFCNGWRRMLILMMVTLATMVVFYQLLAIPSGSYFPPSLNDEKTHSFVKKGNTTTFVMVIGNGSTTDLVKGVDDTSSGELEKEVKGGGDGFESDRLGKDVAFGETTSSMRKYVSVENNRVEQLLMEEENSIALQNGNAMEKKQVSSSETSVNTSGASGSTSSTPTLMNSSSIDERNQVLSEASLRKESSEIERYVRQMRGATITFSDMQSMLIKGQSSFTSLKPRWSSARDRELLNARLQIESAPVLRKVADLHAPLFRNVSMFKRSYTLMERLFKIYVYKEGEKPIFHHPKLRGIYAAEGWFMKLIESSKRYSVRDPKRAHLYYLPFSSDTLRWTLYANNSHSTRNLEQYLTDHVNLIKRKYRFWNRTEGADHFFVACHDWAPRITRKSMSSCIRALCNANAAREFSIGKDVSVPVTYIRSGNNPLRDIGGKSPAEREILAFFAGSMHGYLRPLLLKYWGNKVPEMKIFDQMSRDIEGKALYREYMKSSKYCICARGYGVHTPRVVESIFYECVPVIISDNYVPPFFEVLNWEAFAIFIQEKDIPNLRNILLSIPPEKYLDMQMKLKMVQRHFLWHKIPEKYDLFHMILHSIWYSRVSHVRLK